LFFGATLTQIKWCGVLVPADTRVLEFLVVGSRSKTQMDYDRLAVDCLGKGLVREHQVWIFLLKEWVFGITFISTIYPYPFQVLDKNLS
jgi:hypothetical protein